MTTKLRRVKQKIGSWRDQFETLRKDRRKLVKLLRECQATISAGLESDGDMEPEWSIQDKDLLARIDAAIERRD